jgi:RHS repeat-associated protein
MFLTTFSARGSCGLNIRQRTDLHGREATKLRPTKLEKLVPIALVSLLLSPNFLSLIRIDPSILASQPQPPSSTGGAPPTGNATVGAYTPLPLKCPLDNQSQPLVPTTGSWSTTLRVPYSSFGGAANGAFITQRFTVYQNGTFVASDDEGNWLETRSPDLRLSAAASTSLLTNATTAVQTTQLTVGRRHTANVTLTFSVYEVGCQPAGIRVVASGGADWGAAKRGVFALSFKTKPTSVTAYTAWFGKPANGTATPGHRRPASNRTQALGFDWSDSRALSPSYDHASNTLSWSVGPRFDIDPATVASTNYGAPLSGGYEGHVCYAQGLYWVFYYDGASEGYRTSADYGNTWSGEKTLSVTSTGPQAVSFACSGNEVAYVSGDGGVSSTSKLWHYRLGTLRNDSTIAWNMTSEATRSASYTAPVNPVAVFDSNGSVWAQLDTYKPTIINGKPQDFGTNYAEVWEGTSCGPGGCAWTGQLAQANAFPGVLVPLTQGKLAFLYQAAGACTTDVVFRYNSTWSSPAATSGSCYDLASSGYASLGDTLEVGFNDPVSDAQGYVSVPFAAAPAWGAPVTMESDSGGTVGIASDNSTTLVMYVGHATTVDEYTSSDSGTTWSNATALSTTEPAPVSDVDAMPQFGGNSSVIWAAGGTIRFQDPGPPPSPTWSMAGAYLGDLGAQISPGSGLLTVAQTDLYLPGRGMDLAITRVFSEPFKYNVGLHGATTPYQFETSNMAFVGAGWSLDFPWLGSYAVHLYGGVAVPYSWKGSVFEYHGLTDFKLTKNPDSSYTLVLSDGRVYQFNAAKQLLSITDRAGDSIQFTWGVPCLLGPTVVTKITDTDGRTVSFSYDCFTDRLASVSYGSRTWSYAYSSAIGGQLSSVTDPLGRWASFSYDSTGWLMTKITFPTGAYATFGYARAAIASGYWRELASSENEYTASGAYAKGDGISYGVDSGTGRVTYAIATFGDQAGSEAISYYRFNSENGFVYSKDAPGRTIRMTDSILDTSGRVRAAITYGSNGAAELAESTMTYDSWGNVKSYTDFISAAASVTTFYAYANTDSASSWPASICPRSNFYSNSVSGNVHDALTGVCTNPGSVQEYFHYNGNGFPTQSKRLDDPGGGSSVWLTTDYTYSGALLTKVEDPATGRYVSYGYNGDGLLSSQTGGDSYTYDSNGFVTAMTDQGGNAFHFVNDADGRVTEVDDPSGTVHISYPGNTVETVDENGHATTEVYDGLGRLLSVSGPVNGESYTYNWLGEAVSETVPSGHVYYSYYDPLGRLTKVLNPDGSYRTVSYGGTRNTVTAVDEDGHSVTYTYNWKGWLTAVSTYGASYGYDKLGRLTSSTVAGQTTSYYYDDVGNLYKTLYPGGTTETATFDADGNMVARVSPNGTSTSYSYDNLGELTRVTQGGSMLSFGYDGYGHVTSSSGSGFAAVSRSYNWRGELTGDSAGGLSVTYGYDAAGNLASIQYPDGPKVSMTYDSQDRLTSVGGYATSITYSPGNDPSAVHYGNGASQSFSYDSRDRLSGANGVGYGLDAVGNLGANGDGGVTYSYNGLDQLTGSSGGSLGATGYTYDSAGNLKTMTENGATTTLNYPSPDYSNELSSTSVRGVPKTTYTYDKDGNMITRNGTAWRFYYNYQDEMTKAVQSGQTVETNLFDGLGRRISRTEGSVTTTYAYIGDRVLYEQNSTGGTVTSRIDHVYGDGFQVAEVVDGVTYYPVQDYVGSTVKVSTNSDPPGTSFAASYYPWGNAVITVPGSESLKFTGMPYDGATGLYLFGTRFYDPTIGRFVQQDPSAGSLSDPLSLNRYAYAEDNPTTFSDPTGYDSTTTSTTCTTTTSASTCRFDTDGGIIPMFAIATVVILTLGVGLPLTVAAFGGEAAVAGGAGVVVAEDIVQSSTPEEESLPEGVSAAARMLENLGPPPEGGGDEVGRWGEDFWAKILEPMGFVRGKVIQTFAGELRLDFFNPETGLVIETKLGNQPLSEEIETQMTKYAAAQMSGQISRVLYVLMDNPWSGSFIKNQEFFEWLDDYGLNYVQVG